jgi:hypothetical protein
MSLRAEHAERLVALFVLGCLVLTYPLMALFNRSGMVFGIPLLYAYLFGVWAVLIALAAWTVHRGRGEAPPDGKG